MKSMNNNNNNKPEPIQCRLSVDYRDNNGDNQTWTMAVDCDEIKQHFDWKNMDADEKRQTLYEGFKLTISEEFVPDILISLLLNHLSDEYIKNV